MAFLKGKRPVVGRKDDDILMALCVGIVAVSLLAGCASKEQQAVDMYLDAVMLGELGQHQLAIEKLNEVIKLNDRFTLAYSELGRAYQAAGDLDGAAEVLRRATELDPSSFDDQRDLAQVYEKQGSFGAAAAAYAGAGQLRPKELEMQLKAARCYLQAGQASKALGHCEAARDLDKASYEATMVMAQVYESQKDYAKAAEIYRQALVIKKDDADATEGLGLAYVKNEEFALARDAFTSLLQIRANGAAIRNLAFCFLKLGNQDEAIRVYEQALELDGEDWEAHRGLGVACMVKAGKTDDARLEGLAVEHWRRALAINPNQPKRQMLEKLIREHSKPTNPLKGLND